jgi:hypothetical protein
MRHRGLSSVLCLTLQMLVVTGGAASAAVTVQFNPADPTVGPFPTDFLTVPDPNQKTGVRINMPLPDCSVDAGQVIPAPNAGQNGSISSTCFELGVVNKYDGFNVNPRFRFTFTGLVDVNTLAAGIYYVALNNLTNEEIGLNRLGQIIGVNRLFYDPLTNTAYGKPNDFMDQHRRYALVITDAVKDPTGAPVIADSAFSTCVTAPSTSYCQELSQLVGSFGTTTFPGNIISAAFFTTLSGTTFMEKARATIADVNPAIRKIGPKIFKFTDIASWKYRGQNAVNPVGFHDIDLPTVAANELYGIDRIGFGSFTSPDFRDDSLFIADPPTLLPVAMPTKSNEVYFEIFYPDYPEPPGGYPVVIAGHGFEDNRLGIPLALAPQLNALGYAVIASTFVGYGYGPLSQVVIKENDGTVTTMLAGGRSNDYNGDGIIDDYEGCPIFGALRTRDCIRQSAIDIMSMVKAIQNGIDLDGDGKPDLDASHIYFDGHTAGGVYGSIVTALEPAVLAGAFQEAGATVYDMLLQSVTLTPLLTTIVLVGHVPSLLNEGAGFNDNYVYRDLPPVVNKIPGAVELQNFFELGEWITITADPTVWAPHFTATPLPGKPRKPMLFEMAWGDKTIPNPTVTAMVRAANMPADVRYYRNDIAHSIFSYFPVDPVAFLATLSTDPEKAVAISAVNIVGDFFATKGSVIYDPNDLMRIVFGTDLWEVPLVLTETRNFIK